jgi:hypothetical protein
VRPFVYQRIQPFCCHATDCITRAVSVFNCIERAQTCFEGPRFVLD